MLCGEEGSVSLIIKVVIRTSTSEKRSQAGVLHLPLEGYRPQQAALASCLLSSMVCTAAGLISITRPVWWMECRSLAALACLGKAVTLLCCCLGFEHPIFWAEREAGLADEVQGEDARDAASAQEMQPANPCWRPAEPCWQTPLVQQWRTCKPSLVLAWVVHAQ